MPPLAHAPDLLGASGWRNVERPVDLRHDLAGRVVLLLFFAPGCIHSWHALATMELLDARFEGRPLSVLGVATPRHAADEWLEDVVHARGVRFPIALDAERRIFEAYGCGVWPTLVAVDATGRVRFHGGGEPDGRALVEAVKTLLAEVEYAGYASLAPATVCVEPEPQRQALAQPSGVAFDPGRRLLWIVDTGHHRLLAVDAGTGEVKRVLGSLPGASDGDADSATWFAPSGAWFDAALDRLVVADTGNHLLRAVDASFGVSTLLGTGARAFDRYGGASGVGQGLASPTAATGDATGLLVAMTGLHQVWSVAPGDGIAMSRVGTGFLGSADGVAAHARLAEPRAVAVRGDEVAICDSGNHALRLWTRGDDSVRKLVGGTAGDADGDLEQARLCEPRAVLFAGAELIVADTGNGKLRRVDPAGGRVRTLEVGIDFGRPTALALDGRRLYVADAARNQVVVVDLDAMGAEVLAVVPPVSAPSDPVVVRLRAEADCVLKIALPLPPGASVLEDVAVRVTLQATSGRPLAIDLTYEAAMEGALAVVRGVKTGAAGEGAVRADLRYHTSHGRGRAAHPQRVSLEARFVLEPGAPVMAQWLGGSRAPDPIA